MTDRFKQLAETWDDSTDGGGVPDGTYECTLILWNSIEHSKKQFALGEFQLTLTFAVSSGAHSGGKVTVDIFPFLAPPPGSKYGGKEILHMTLRSLGHSVSKKELAEHGWAAIEAALNAAVYGESRASVRVAKGRYGTVVGGPSAGTGPTSKTTADDGPLSFEVT